MGNNCFSKTQKGYETCIINFEESQVFCAASCSMEEKKYGKESEKEKSTLSDRLGRGTHASTKKNLPECHSSCSYCEPQRPKRLNAWREKSR